MSDTTTDNLLRGLRGDQRLVIERMIAGHRLMWWGDNGPEMSGFDFWPQKRTVRALIRAGSLKWGNAYNKTQEECGIYPLELAV